MKSPLHIRSTLQPTELGQNHEELAVDVVDWVQHCDTQYGCTDVVCREVRLFLHSERLRGQCSFIRTNNKPSVSQKVNEARACLRSNDMHPTGQAKQHGHAAAATVKFNAL